MDELSVVEHAEVVILEVQNNETLVVEVVSQGPPGRSGPEASISADPYNRLKRGSDDGLFVHDDLTEDPIAYYILAKA